MELLGPNNSQAVSLFGVCDPDPQFSPYEAHLNWGSDIRRVDIYINKFDTFSVVATKTTDESYYLLWGMSSGIVFGLTVWALKSLRFTTMRHDL